MTEIAEKAETRSLGFRKRGLDERGLGIGCLRKE